jgi:DNA-binding NtrC family response regulator
VKTYREAEREFHREYFNELLAASGGHVQSAANASGLHRSVIYRRLRECGFAPRSYRRRGNSEWVALGGQPA